MSDLALTPNAADLLADGKIPTINRGLRVEQCGIQVVPSQPNAKPDVNVVLAMAGGIKQVFTWDQDTLAMLCVLIHRTLPAETIGNAAVRLGKL